jgi:hypothetical protein
MKQPPNVNVSAERRETAYVPYAVALKSSILSADCGNTHKLTHVSMRG